MEQLYDPSQQLSIDRKTGNPIVTTLKDEVATNFGETVYTATREGADQTEIATQGSSHRSATPKAPEKAEIRSLAEQSQLKTDYGETALTKTIEGVDCTEIASADSDIVDAPYTHFG
ncbi:MAG: hypothetical protein OXP09_08390 [Gammaproteobacteria bacterium]|nr:hypothetical protein [Gammaproteobacteria bacterium]